MYDHGLGLDANVRSMRKPDKKKNRITPALAHARLIEAANGTSAIIKCETMTRIIATPRTESRLGRLLFSGRDTTRKIPKLRAERL